jgi:transcriptional regulator with XRE-family HTH domain
MRGQAHRNNHRLREAREQLGLSQREAAELIGVSVVTYQQWEQGKMHPQPFNLRQIRLKFEPYFHTLNQTPPASSAQEEPARAPKQEEIPPSQQSGPPQGQEPAARVLTLSFEESMTFHLLSLAYQDHLSSRDRCIKVRQAIEGYDAMNIGNKSYQITRREAISTLASLPLASLGLCTLASTLSPAQYGTALAHCSASLQACWQLLKSYEADDLTLAFKRVSQYLPLLETIVKDSTQYRKEAADLAAQYAILETILGWHRQSRAEAILYARNALTYSEIAENRALQLSAYSKLAWAYLYEKKYKSALTTAQEAQYLLEHTPTPLPSCIQGGIYSTLALMQAKSGKDADVALGRIQEIDPGDEMHAFMQFTRSDLPREVGMIHYYRGDQARAMEALEQLIDPTTLAAKIPEGKRGRIEIFNTMTRASLKTKDRDIEKTVHLWMAAMEETRSLQSEWGFSETLATYKLMEVIWPGEKRIIDLRDLTEHW